MKTSTRSRRGTKAWELWWKGDEWSEGDGFVEAFGDKGAALARMRLLRRSHPGTHYYLKHRRSPRGQHWDAGRARRLRGAKMADRWRDRSRRRRVRVRPYKTKAKRGWVAGYSRRRARKKGR